MITKRLGLQCAALCAAMCLAVSAAPSADWSFTYNASEVSPWGQGVAAAIKFLGEKTNGKYAGRAYPNGILFQANWSILLEMVQTNSVQAAVEANTALASLQSKVNFLSLPFLFKDNQHVYRFLNSGCATWDALIKSFENQDIVILGAAPRPMRQLSNNKRRVATLEDIKGLVIRSPSNTTIISTMEAVGIKAVPMPSGDIYSGIQLGTVDGEDNSLAQQYDVKTYEVIKYFTIWNYIADGSMLFMSKQLYDSCPPEDQNIFKEMGKVFADTCFAADDAYFKVAYDAMIKSGIEITEMSDAEKQRCADACAPVYEEFKKNLTEAEWKDLMDAVERTRN
jgi:C4-dicarboxylate-binding protein DctP